MGDLVTLAQKLLDHYPTKAVELLVFYLQDKDIRTATEQYIGQHDPSPAKLDTAFEQQRGSLPALSHHRSPSLHQGMTRQNIPDARISMHTPPTSAGSVKSHASGLAAAGMEKIYFLSDDDQGKDQAVISRCTPGKYNLIGDKVAYGRGLIDGQFGVGESVLVYLSSGEQRWVGVKAAVNLTWRRPNEFKTSMDTFYIVPARLLDSDVVLASEEYLERELPSGVQEAHPPQAHYQRGFVAMEEHSPAVNPHAPTATMSPYQQSCLPPPPSPAVQRPYDRVQTMRDTQRMQATEPSAPATHPRQMDRGQPTQMTTPVAAQGQSSSQLQVIGFWDKTPIRISFDPDATGEVFYQAFHQWAEKRNRGGDLDRQKMTLWIKTSKATPDEEAYELGLGVSELEELWETAVGWIQENKNSKVPHLYATVAMEAG